MNNRWRFVGATIFCVFVIAGCAWLDSNPPQPLGGAGEPQSPSKEVEPPKDEAETIPFEEEEPSKNKKVPPEEKEKPPEASALAKGLGEAAREYEKERQRDLEKAQKKSKSRK